MRIASSKAYMDGRSYQFRSSAVVGLQRGIRFFSLARTYSQLIYIQAYYQWAAFAIDICLLLLNLLMDCRLDQVYGNDLIVAYDINAIVTSVWKIETMRKRFR